MGDKSKIEWTDATWNPIIGCSPVSEGCLNCYAERMAGRFCQPGEYYEGVVIPMTLPRRNMWTGKTVLKEHKLDEPLRWRKPRTIFVCSMGDLFHESVPFDWVDSVLVSINCALQHRFMILTKRPERMMEMMTEWYQAHCDPTGGKPLSNLALGVSIENQQAADERIPILLQTPAAHRFVSVEPALGSVNLQTIVLEKKEHGPDVSINALYGWHGGADSDRTRIDLVIMGGESGPDARPMHPEWARSVRDQCEAAGVPFHFKQWGEWRPTHERRCNDPGIKGKPWHNFDPDTSVCRVGKKAAGRLLVGREHNGRINWRII